MAISEKDKRKSPESDPTWRWMMPAATFCDYFVTDVYGDPPVVRFVFGEWLEKGTHPIYRTAVVMTLRDAKALTKVLTETIEEKEAAELKKKKAPDPDE